MPRQSDPREVIEIESVKERPSGDFHVRVKVDWVGVRSNPHYITLTIPAFHMVSLWKAYEERRKREDEGRMTE